MLLRQAQRLFLSNVTKNTFQFSKLPQNVVEELSAANDRAAKEKFLESNNFQAQVLVTEGWYFVEYFHSWGANDKVIVSNGQLVTAKANTNNTKIYVKRHVVGGVSLYETLQESISNQWIKATTGGNSFGAEGDATWFQVLGAGDHFVFQYVSPQGKYQLGVHNEAIGTPLKLFDSYMEFMKLIPA
jgi:hypothetical protein